MFISKIELRNLSRILSRTIYAGAGDKIEAFKQQSREATWSVREGRSLQLGSNMTKVADIYVRTGKVH